MIIDSYISILNLELTFIRKGLLSSKDSDIVIILFFSASQKLASETT